MSIQMISYLVWGDKCWAQGFVNCGIKIPSMHLCLVKKEELNGSTFGFALKSSLSLSTKPFVIWKHISTLFSDSYKYVGTYLPLLLGGRTHVLHISIGSNSISFINSNWKISCMVFAHYNLHACGKYVEVCKILYIQLILSLYLEHFYWATNIYIDFKDSISLTYDPKTMC